MERKIERKHGNIFRGNRRGRDVQVYLNKKIDFANYKFSVIIFQY
jgi:hypothetical protein